jgi:hypothetical protein
MGMLRVYPDAHLDCLWTAVIDISLRGQGLFPFWMTVVSRTADPFYTALAIHCSDGEISSFNLLPLVMLSCTW